MQLEHNAGSSSSIPTAPPTAKAIPHRLSPSLTNLPSPPWKGSFPRSPPLLLPQPSPLSTPSCGSFEIPPSICLCFSAIHRSHQQPSGTTLVHPSCIPANTGPDLQLFSTRLSSQSLVAPSPYPAPSGFRVDNVHPAARLLLDKARQEALCSNRCLEPPVVVNLRSFQPPAARPSRRSPRGTRPLAPSSEDRQASQRFLRFSSLVHQPFLPSAADSLSLLARNLGTRALHLRHRR